MDLWDEPSQRCLANDFGFGLRTSSFLVLLPTENEGARVLCKVLYEIHEDSVSHLLSYNNNSLLSKKILILFRYWLIIKRYWVKLAAVSITWFIYDWITYRKCGHLIPQLLATDDSTAFGLYATPITDAADPNGTLYTSIGWGCLINFFYLVGASRAML